MSQEPLKEMHKMEGLRKIGQIERKLLATENNIEISEEIITHTPSDTHREQLTEKNRQRRRAVGAMRREIRDIEQTIEEREKEVST